MANGFFYSGQIRRFLVQFIRIMSHFTVEFGKDSTGNKALQQVPVFYGDSSRQAAQIIRGNSENAMPTVPAMACYITAFQYDRARVQEPHFVSKLRIKERAYNSTTDEWDHTFGDAFTVERPMPVPYKLTLKVDIWTSNTEQKLQLLEQMVPLFNPALEIQSTDNYIDWTSLSAIYLTDTSWTSRTVPAGGEDSIDVATLTFELPIWLSLPAKVTKAGVIQKIFSSIFDANGDMLQDITDMPTAELMSRRIITPLNYGVIYYNNTLQLFLPHNIVSQTIDKVSLNVGDTFHWSTLVTMYDGHIKNGVTQLRLEQPNGSTVVGTVSEHPTDPTLLLYSPFADTIPSNTLSPVTAIIDPFHVSVDSAYINAIAGTRYLILHDIGSADNVEAAEAWHGSDGSELIAKANDIIEFDGIRWFVSFSAAGHAEIKYCTNLKSGIQFKWIPTEQYWSKSIEGKYQAGDWTIIL